MSINKEPKYKLTVFLQFNNASSTILLYAYGNSRKAKSKCRYPKSGPKPQLTVRA